MAKLFLLNESIDNLIFDRFQLGIDELVLIDKDDGDLFCRNDGLYQIDNYAELYQNFSQENNFRAQYLEQLASVPFDPKSIVELYEAFEGKPSGFFGINFPQLNIDINYCITNNKEFKTFKSFLYTKIDHSNFSVFKDELFPNIIFCDNSEQQLIGYGKGKYFEQCIDQFVMLEEYLKSWTKGNFSYQDLKDRTAITLSPESQTTMGKHGHERNFKLPSGKSAVFELHIKLGDIRIHILEDNTSKKIMIGYIGKHLST